MASEMSAPRTRRAFLTAAAATAAVTVISVIESPGQVQAALRKDTTPDYSTRGTASVRSGRSWVDVNAARPGSRAIDESHDLPADVSQCYASLQRYRSGVYIAAVRPNYPTAGQIRIYLNKKVSSPIPVVWWVLWPPPPDLPF